MEEGFRAEQTAFPIWLLGDSYPGKFVNALNGALDPRHPTRHTIWTPIWDSIQETVYPLRVDRRHLLVCNAAAKQKENDKPDRDFAGASVPDRIQTYRGLLEAHRPAMVICFGWWAYEFARRALDQDAVHHTKRYWKISRLGHAFRDSCNSFAPGHTTLFPLLHQVVALQWQHADRKFSSPEADVTYFDYVGRHIGTLLLDHRDKLGMIWRQTKPV